MRDGLFAAKRPIVFSICEWGSNKPWEWAGEIGHLWRTTGDISDSWNSMISILSQQKDLAKYAGPSHWNDPDMLEVGNGGMTTEEYKTHFSLWCMLSAPLLAGNDIQNMSPETKSILTNREIIALDQDILGKQGELWRNNGDYQVWMKMLANNEKAVCLLNSSDEKKTVLVDFGLFAQASTEGAEDSKPLKLENFTVRDLWDHKDLVLKESSMYIDLLPHTVKVYRFMKK
jgi:alpha-galactosidase